ncbi:NAD-dependent epimerase/dehydratase family protein [Promicromonospora sp. NPDC023987]|uniref:NAD-dependent epimerase/dehydratase family protein n=1 Tax=Promicromonospora sp. NPDC023987 TaxID=3155360 RepID=UPI0033F5AF5A
MAAFVVLSCAVYRHQGACPPYLGPSAERVRFLAADVTDAESIRQAMDEARPDAVVHGATVTHDARSELEHPGRPRPGGPGRSQ